MRMLLRRLADAVVLLWLVLSLTFLLVRAAPGDPAAMLIPPSASPADAGRLRAELGLDASLPVQYARWAKSTLRGDLGMSFAQRRPVTSVLGDAIPISLALGGISLALTFLIGVALGTLQAAKRGTSTDVALTVGTTAVYAAPSYWLALTLVAVFTYGATYWGFPAAMRLPAFGMRSPGLDLNGYAAGADLVRHALLPVFTLTVIGAAGIARYTRSIVADILDAPFVRTARAKGARPFSVHARHVLRNALPPLVVLFALALPGTLAGSVFVETVFAWPGMGRALVTAIGARDYPVVLGATAIYAALVIGANLCGDLALPALDPRRRSS
ncbi:MAG: ABC transporter permease [Gemmatimonadota bacterium]|nr:ABC transporter permease [Gemmatimonadota bacterium]